MNTIVLPASLTSVEEIVKLAGIDHITIAPKLLQELASTDASSFPNLPSESPKRLSANEGLEKMDSDDEQGFMTALKGDQNGINEAKLMQVSVPLASPRLRLTFENPNRRLKSLASTRKNWRK